MQGNGRLYNEKDLPKLWGKFIDKVWGKFETEEERISWSNLQKPLADADREKYRRDYIEMDLPYIICSHLYRNSSTTTEFKTKLKKQRQFVEAFNLKDEFNNAYKIIINENQ